MTIKAHGSPTTKYFDISSIGKEGKIEGMTLADLKAMYNEIEAVLFAEDPNWVYENYPQPE